MNLDHVLTVRSDLAGWSYTSSPTTSVSAWEPVILAGEFTYAWAFDNEQIPGRLLPATATFTLSGTSVAALPDVQQGDRADVLLVIGPNGTTLVHVEGIVTDAVVELTPASKRPARLTVTVTDHLADLASRFPTYPGGATGRRGTRWAALSSVLGLSIGAPVGMDRTEPRLALGWGNGSAESIAASLSSSYAPGGVHHSLVPYRGGGYPLGYTWVDYGVSAPGEPFPDPNTVVKYLLQPTSRYMPDNPPSVVLSGAYCQVPATARRGREHITNVVRLKGVWQALNNSIPGADLEKDATREVGSADAAARGPLGHDLDTQLVVGIFRQEAPDVFVDDFGVNTAAIRAAQVHLSDATALAAAWTFDEFTVLSHKMPLSIALDVLPRLVPQYAGNGDGRLVRHLVVTDLPPHARLTSDGTVRGFITKGTVSISAGKLRHTISTTPGDPTPPPY